MAFKKQNDTEVSVIQFTQQRARFKLVGVSPIILYRMSQKAKRELLMPKGRSNTATRAQSLKHDPIAEFVEAPYRLPPDSQALLCHLATAFKSAIRNCAVDMPGASKAQIGRMLYVEGEHVPIFGVPKLHMSIVRCAGIAKTPDVRTRCILPTWACELSIVFMRPTLTLDNVAHLVAGAGLMQGVGDWRPEKGSGTYGQFRLVDEGDAVDLKAWETLVTTGGYDAQMRAMEWHEPYDDEARELLEWFGGEATRRQMTALPGGNGKRAQAQAKV